MNVKNVSVKDIKRGYSVGEGAGPPSPPRVSQKLYLETMLASMMLKLLTQGKGKSLMKFLLCCC